jgi:hypothetical protein
MEGLSQPDPETTTITIKSTLGRLMDSRPVSSRKLDLRMFKTTTKKLQQSKTNQQTQLDPATKTLTKQI